MSHRYFDTIEPFEICSIRPPTENYSLTFRLTRNCGWNRCLFCPVYKYGARFSRRSREEVEEDIRRARVICDLLMDLAAERGAPGQPGYEDAGAILRQARLRSRSAVETETLPAAHSDEDEIWIWHRGKSWPSASSPGCGPSTVSTAD